jgi:hypothetical protein
MVEGHRDSGERSARRRLDFSFDVNMAGSPRHCDEEKGASPRDQPRKGEKKYITEEHVRHVWYQRLLSLICSRNMNTSIGSVASMNQKKKNMNTILGRV